MQTYDYNILTTIVEVPSRSIRRIEALEDHISKLNNESGNAESIGESHVPPSSRAKTSPLRLRLPARMLTRTIFPFMARMLQVKPSSQRKAKYDKTITYYMDGNNHLLEGDAHTYPVSSLRSNRAGTSYSWVERTNDGTITTRTADKPRDAKYELTIKEDLPATDTEPRVERTLEYKVKSEDTNAGKEVCVEKRFDGLFSPLPECDKDKTEGKLIKSRTIIHIPAGSFDKIVTVTSE